MRRTPMKRSAWPGRQEERPKPPPPMPVPGRFRLATPVNEADFAGGAPKPEAHRNRHLLDIARGMPCLLRVFSVCNDDRATTVAAHSNLHRHGKGGARKADDEYSVWACARCHTWLDSSYSADFAEKEDAFITGHARQAAAWLEIASDPKRSERDRAAAQWALDRLH